MHNLCHKCVYKCFEQCPATADDTKSGSKTLTSSSIIFQCDKYEYAKPEPRGGWSMDKNIEDFKQIAYNMRQEGKISRADTIMYLIERVKIAEGRFKETDK